MDLDVVLPTMKDCEVIGLGGLDCTRHFATDSSVRSLAYRTSISDVDRANKGSFLSHPMQRTSGYKVERGP